MTGTHSHALALSKPFTQSSTCSRYVGRVGALAAALGIGVMVATSAGMATADSTATGASSTDASAAAGTDNSGASSSTGERDGGAANTATTATTGTDISSTTTTGGVNPATPDNEPPTTIPGTTIPGTTSTPTAESSTAEAVLGDGDQTAVESGESAAAGDPATSPASSSSTAPPPATQQLTTPTVEKDSSSHTGDGDKAPLSVTKASSSNSLAGDGGVDSSVVQPLATDVTSGSTPRTFGAETSDTAPAGPAIAAASTLVAPVTQVAAPVAGVVGFLNSVVTTLLNPFLAPAPSTGDPVTPVLWAVLGWVRRNLFNQSPTITYNGALTAQTGQTLTGNIGAADPEGDALTYTVTQEPEHGTLTIDQATGAFTYTPDDINYTAAQADTFSVSVTDGKFNLLGLLAPRNARADIGVSVLNPTVQRVILDLPDTIKSPANPRYSDDGNSIFFAGQPTTGGRSEIYQINADGTDVRCVTCGVSISETGNLAKPVPVNDGSGRVLVLVNVDGQPPRYSMLEDGGNGKEIVPITTGAGIGFVIDKQREMRVSPDGTKVLYTRIVIGPNQLLQALPIVGTLDRTATGYEITDERVVYPTGEGKQWTPDGKGVLILGGQFDAGNVDDIEVDLATGEAHRVTANLDYDEDLDMSPNRQWIAIGSTRGLDALTPMTRIVRQNFLPVYVGAPVYLSYAVPINVSNQEWAVALEDELKGENGIPLFDTGDGYAARSMPSWNSAGDAVTFWESSVEDPSVSRLVIANLKYTTSVGPVSADTTTPNPTWAPNLSTYVPTTTPLPSTGTYNGANGGTAVVSEAPDPMDATRTIRTVTYTNYVDSDRMVLNGTESADYNASQVAVHYLADVTVTGTHTGSLKADAVINAFQQSLTGYITSVVDGDVQTLPDPAAAEAAQQSA